MSINVFSKTNCREISLIFKKNFVLLIIFFIFICMKAIYRSYVSVKVLYYHFSKYLHKCLQCIW